MNSCETLGQRLNAIEAASIRYSVNKARFAFFFLSAFALIVLPAWTAMLTFGALGVGLYWVGHVVGEKVYKHVQTLNDHEQLHEYSYSGNILQPIRHLSSVWLAIQASESVVGFTFAVTVTPTIQKVSVYGGIFLFSLLFALLLLGSIQSFKNICKCKVCASS